MNGKKIGLVAVAMAAACGKGKSERQRIEGSPGAGAGAGMPASAGHLAAPRMPPVVRVSFALTPASAPEVAE